MSIPSDDLESNIPSKSQRKRDSEKLQLMGSQLVEMPDNQLQKFSSGRDIVTGHL